MTRTPDASSASVLLTDLYQLTMVTAYHALGMERVAAFEFFVRRLPPQRGFLVAAGLAQALDYLESLRFEAADLDWLTAQLGACHAQADAGGWTGWQAAGGVANHTGLLS